MSIKHIIRFCLISLLFLIIYFIHVKLSYFLVAFYYLICLLRYLFYRSRIGYMSLYQQTLYFCSDLPYVNVISGAIRSGKTTLLFALSHLMTFVIFDKISTRMREIERILYFVNFTKIITLYENITLKHNDRIKYVFSNLIKVDDYGHKKLIYNLGQVYYDYLHSDYNIKLLEEYLTLYMHSKRDDYIYSRSKAFNQLTKKYSLQFDPEWMKLKENKDFPLDEYSVFLDDEKSLESSNIKNGGKAEDDGTDIFFRLFGHIFRELSWYFTTLQNAQRWTKAEREIAQFHIYVKKSYLIGDFPKLKHLLDKLENINQFFYRLILKFYKNSEFKNNDNLFKRISFWILQKQKLLTSKGFICFSTNCFHDTDNVKMDIKPDDETSSAYSYDFVVPVCYVWHIGDTHAFHPIIDKLYNQSKIFRDDLGRVELDHIDFDRILTPYKDQKNNEAHNFTSTDKSTNDENLEELF